MTGGSAILLVSGIVIITVLVYWYYKTAQVSPVQRLVLAALRWLGLLTLLVLILDPKVEQQEWITEKPVLTLLMDESASVPMLADTIGVQRLMEELLSNQGIQERFKVQQFRFSSGLNDEGFKGFAGTQSDQGKALRELAALNDGRNEAVLFLTDGNQTLGNPFEYYKGPSQIRIYPVILGDTTVQHDLRIERVNANRYAFRGNEFEVEVLLSCEGSPCEGAAVTIEKEGRVLNRIDKALLPGERSKALKVILPADRPGLQAYTVRVSGDGRERFMNNNEKHFAVEVLDQKRRLAIVSAFPHPDLGVLRRIATTQQSEVVFLKPGAALPEEGFPLFIFFQPDDSHEELLNLALRQGSGIWIIDGEATDWDWLNRQMEGFSKFEEGASEEVSALMNNGFSKFQAEPLDFGNYPPLKRISGDVQLSPGCEILLYESVEGIATGNPLLWVCISAQQQKSAVLNGNGIWRWRAQQFLQQGDFEAFDRFILSFMQYLASAETRERLSLRYEPFYQGAASAVIQAYTYDENFNFDPRAQPVLKLNLEGQEKSIELPMTFKNDHFEYALGQLDPGRYKGWVSATGGLKKSLQFEILPFSAEQQSSRVDAFKLSKLAKQNGGELLSLKDPEAIISMLLEGDEWVPVARANRMTASLVHWNWLLVFLIVLSGIEWFYRKYIGLL